MHAAIVCTLAIFLVAPAKQVKQVLRTEAAEAFAAGEAAYRDGDYDEAVTHFSRAHELVPHPAALYNVGLSREKAGDLTGAWKTYRRLSNVGDMVVRKDATAARARVEKRLAIVRIRASGRSPVCIDGYPLVPDRRGEHVTAIHPGKHHVQVEDHHVHVRFQRGEERTIDLDLAEAIYTARPPAQAVRGLMVTSVIASTLSLGFGAGVVAASEEPSLVRGLGSATIVSSAVALGTGIAALVIHQRHKTGARAEAAPLPKDRQRRVCTHAPKDAKPKA